MNFITIDFETASRKMDSACEIGVAKYSNLKLVDEYSYLIKPKVNQFDWFNTKLHGLNKSSVENEPEFDVIYSKIKNDLENNPVFAHNAKFDMTVLASCLNLFEIPYPNLSYGCSYQLSKQHFPKLLSYKLSSLCSFCNIPFENNHRGLEDAKACGQILCTIFEELDISSFEDLKNKINFRFKVLEEIINPPIANLSSNINADPNSYFFGKFVVFTGTLQSLVRKEAQSLVVQQGGACSSSINRQTNFLILGDQDFAAFGEGHKSTKIKRAEKLLEEGQKIEMLTESQFLELL